MSGRQVETDRFEAVADDGSVHTVVVLRTESTITPVASGVRSKHRGSTEYVLSSGEDVTKAPDGSFVVVRTGRVLRRR